MKANELMIGDWVMPLKKKLKGIPGKVVTIDGGTGVCWIDSEDYSCLVPCSDVERIPITHEILEKNGFKDMGFFGKLEIGPWRLICDSGNLAVLHEGREEEYINIPISYVHELQHCLKLVGITKDIVL